MTPDTLSPDLLQRMDAYWRASNYLAVGQLYLYDNPLLRQPLTLAHIKPLVVGQWGTVPGQNFIYVHLNRVICQHGLNMLYIAGPGHGGAALVAQVYLEGSWSEVYPEVTEPGGAAQALHAVFLSWGDLQPRGAHHPGFDPRGRRAGLFAQPCLWRGVRQPRVDCRLCGGRW